MIRWETDPLLMTDAELVAEYRASDAEAADQRQTALATEIERRDLDL